MATHHITKPMPLIVGSIVNLGPAQACTPAPAMQQARFEREWIAASQLPPMLTDGSNASAHYLVFDAGTKWQHTALYHFPMQTWFEVSGYNEFKGVTHYQPLPANPTA